MVTPVAQLVEASDLKSVQVWVRISLGVQIKLIIMNLKELIIKGQQVFFKPKRERIRIKKHKVFTSFHKKLIRNNKKSNKSIILLFILLNNSYKI